MMTSFKIKLNAYSPNHSGRYSLVIQVIHCRERCMLPTGIKIEPEYFDSVKGHIRYIKGGLYNRSVVGKMNLELQQKYEIVLERVCDRTDFTVHDLSVWYKRRKDMSNIFSYLELMIDEKVKIGRYGTAQAYRSTQNSLKKFCRCEKLSFKEIDYLLLKKYESYMLQQGDTHNTVAYYLRNLRTAYNKALDEHLFQLPDYGSPFRRIKATSRPTVKRALCEDQLKSIASLNLSHNIPLEFARDMFMASFYLRGIPFVDLVNLKKSDINGNIIYYNRSKTSVRVAVEIIPQLQEIIDRYAVNGNYLFPFADNMQQGHLSYVRYRNALHRYNHNLRKVGSLAGISIRLTGYVARHSWATRAKDKGIPIAVISEGLAHSSERITQVYLKSFGNDVINEANKIVSIL